MQVVIAIGTNPAVKALDKAIISGCSSIYSDAKYFPVLPKPVITSSAIHNILFALQAFKISFKLPGECIRMQLAPCTKGS